MLLDIVFDVMGSVLLVVGSLLALTAAVGVLRLPDTLARMHASTKPQTLGLLVVLAGSALLLRGGLDGGMLLLAGLFQLVTAPVIAHRVGRLAHQEGLARADLMVVDELAEDRARE